MDLDGKTNKLEHKTQLIEIDKLLINIPNETQNKIKRESKRTGVLHQILLTGSILILACSCGMPIGYSTVILPQLINHPNHSLSMDYEMGSWIASIHSAATPIGSFVSGSIMNQWGRKMALLFSIFPLMSGWVVIALSQSHMMLLLGRVIAGIGVGILAAPAQILLAEISQPNLRGMLIGVPFVSYSCGILIVYGLGSLLDWRTVAWCGLLLPVFSFIAIILGPESPTWLARMGYYDKASKALAWLRGGANNAKVELNQLIEHIENEKSNRNHKSQSILSIIQQPSVLKPLILINVFNVLQILSGTYLIVFYAVDIITEICNFGDSMDISTMQSAVITALIRLLLTIVYCYLLLKCGRRSLYLTSCFCSGISSLVLAVFLYIKGDSPKSLNDLLFIGTVLLLYISFNTACMLIPGIMVGELLPLQVRHWSGMIFTVFNLMMFGIAKLFPIIKYWIRSRGLFVVFGISSLLASLLFYFLLPETKNRTLKDIEEYYQQQNWLWQRRTKKTNKSDQS
ncbi:unnamed protein product [Diamesa hyperborea]